jgi:hypothetical protein
MLFQIQVLNEIQVAKCITQCNNFLQDKYFFQKFDIITLFELHNKWGLITVNQ